MKTTLHIFTFGIITLFFSCGQPNAQKKNAVNSTYISPTKFEKKEKERLEKRKQIEEQNRIDSLRLDKVLNDAFQISVQNFGKKKFHKKYDVIPDGIPVNVEISLDYHFTKKNPHLIIRRKEPGAVYIDIYSKQEGKFEKVISHEQWEMEYMNDTIRDINGDGLNDFVVNWYGSNGCCLKAFSNVYLLKNDQKEFTKNFEFINPSFSPQEKIIRGVCYGHPGETEMYKYKWNGENIDTIEYVYFEKNKNHEKTGKIVISDNEPYLYKFTVLKTLNKVPIEYTKIYGYDWFTGEILKGSH